MLFAITSDTRTHSIMDKMKESSSILEDEKPSVEMKKSWEKAADKYIKNCHKFEIKIDPSVVIALQTGYVIRH